MSCIKQFCDPIWRFSYRMLICNAAASGTCISSHLERSCQAFPWMQQCPSLVCYPPISCGQRSNAGIMRSSGFCLSSDRQSWKPVWLSENPIYLILEIWTFFSWLQMNNTFHLSPAFLSPALLCSLYPQPHASPHLYFLFCFRCKFFSLTETPENYTVVLDEEGFKGKAPLCISFICPPTLWLLILVLDHKYVPYRRQYILTLIVSCLAARIQ